MVHESGGLDSPQLLQGPHLPMSPAHPWRLMAHWVLREKKGMMVEERVNE